MSKIRVTPELIAKVKKAFAEVKEETIKTGQGGLTRGELRALERKGIVERLPIFLKSKFVGVTPQKQWVWRLKDG